MSVKRTAFWSQTAAGPLFTWLHLPAHAAAPTCGGKLGIVICNPVGHEYTHAHRSLRHLADALAAAGYPTLRFDYLGTGDSDDHMLAPRRIEVWLENIQAQVDWLKSNTAVTAVALVGLRLGATLAALSAGRQTVDYLVLWNPCVKGKRYVREMTSLAKMAAAALSYEQNFIETAGFLLSTETLERLKSIDLTNDVPTGNEKVLIVNPDHVSTDDSYANCLRQQNIAVDVVQGPGYLDMLAEPQDTKVPHAAIGAIVDWLARQGPAGDRADTPSTTRLTLGDRHSFRARAPATQRLQAPRAVRESLVIAGQQRQMFGILTQPERQSAAPCGPLVVLSNSGSVHHVGPNRLYVELSRALAEAGLDCFRYDLSNLGDSCCETSVEENHPYPAGAVANLATVLEHLQTELGYREFILAGLCSGSHLSFHAGLSLPDHPIVESVLINPLTFYWEEGMSLEIPSAYQVNKDAKYYEYAVKSLGNWVRLLKGKVDIAYIVKFTLKLFAQRVREGGKNMLERLAILPPSQLGRDLLRFKQAGRNISFIFSRSDPGHKILVSEAKLIARKMANRDDLSLYFIDDADHTFSKREKRDQLTDRLIRHLRHYAFQHPQPAKQQL
ncbi:hypothetical protein FKG94_19150 [Exilibacterium tricleocarpae]|uniref:Serine aminopeptidase S33 domain-containing protein n=1 Tax=Exilibacterium tricleocarpae TaxID=2591008 RepID=A0A545T3I0_9GAMM|nr:alpha/beta fold hydrolase [Exilibacterium tricleocarpae]TQV71766.1 hypothetical protein FKG94_19150 [Exilibacterium tricleocarpae]